MAPPVHPDDDITMLLGRGLQRTRVRDVWGKTFTTYMHPRQDEGQNHTLYQLNTDEEGVTWIRGFHDKHNEGTLALLAAEALRR